MLSTYQQLPSGVPVCRDFKKNKHALYTIWMHTCVHIHTYVIHMWYPVCGSVSVYVCIIILICMHVFSSPIRVWLCLWFQLCTDLPDGNLSTKAQAAGELHLFWLRMAKGIARFVSTGPFSTCNEKICYDLCGTTASAMACCAAAKPGVNLTRTLESSLMSGLIGKLMGFQCFGYFSVELLWPRLRRRSTNHLLSSSLVAREPWTGNDWKDFQHFFSILRDLI